MRLLWHTTPVEFSEVIWFVGCHFVQWCHVDLDVIYMIVQFHFYDFYDVLSFKSTGAGFSDRFMTHMLSAVALCFSLLHCVLGAALSLRLEQIFLRPINELQMYLLWSYHPPYNTRPKYAQVFAEKTQHPYYRLCANFLACTNLLISWNVCAIGLELLAWSGTLHEEYSAVQSTASCPSFAAFM